MAHLRATCRRADYDAAARVLGDRDRWLAKAEAALAEARTGLADLTAEVQAQQERYELEAARRRPSSRSSGGAIAAALPRVDQRAGEPGPKGVIDLCNSSDDDELEEGREFRPDVAGVSCKRKQSASRAEEGRRAGVSCKMKAPASACSPDNEDDEIPLSQLIKKRRRTKPWANGEPKKGHRDVQANSAGPLGVDRPVISHVNRGIPEAVAEHMVGSSNDPKVADFVQGTENGRSGKNGGFFTTMPSPPPTGSTARKSPRKNCSKPDGCEGQARTREKQGPVISPVNRGIPEAVAEHMVGSPDNPKVAVFVHGIGNCQSGKNGGLSRTMPSPKATDSTVGNSPHKNCSKPDGSEGRASSLASAVTRHWKSSSAVFSSFLGNKDLCMQAACALHRQRKFTTQSTEGGRSGCTGLSKFEAHRSVKIESLGG